MPTLIRLYKKLFLEPKEKVEVGWKFAAIFSDFLMLVAANIFTSCGKE